MPDLELLRKEILERLSDIIDPETGENVVRMRLIEDLSVNQDGYVTYKFHPSSPLCPIAMPLALLIQLTVEKVPGVTGQDLQVVGFIMSEELTNTLRKARKGESHAQ